METKLIGWGKQLYSEGKVKDLLLKKGWKFKNISKKNIIVDKYISPSGEVILTKTEGPAIHSIFVVYNVGVAGEDDENNRFKKIEEAYFFAIKNEQIAQEILKESLNNDNCG